MAINCPTSLGESAVESHAVTLESIDPNAGSGGDDSATLLAAVAQADAQRTHVQLGGKTYNLDQPVVIPGSTVIRGCGPMAYRRDIQHGSHLNSRITTGDALTLTGRRGELSDFSITAVTDGWALVADTNTHSLVDRMHIEASGVNTNGLLVRSAYTNKFRDIDIWKTPENKVGLGLWFDTSSGIAGGMTKFENITASYFDINLEFGQEANHNVNERTNSIIESCQGRQGNIGMRIGRGFGHVMVNTGWFEFNRYAQVQIHSRALQTELNSLTILPLESTGYGLVLGLDPALGNNSAIFPVTVNQGRYKSSDVGAAVKIFAPTDVRAGMWHEFDNVEFWNSTSNISRRFETDAVAQIPVLVKRPYFRNVSGAPPVMVDPTGAAFTAPLVLQTAP